MQNELKIPELYGWVFFPRGKSKVLCKCTEDCIVFDVLYETSPTARQKMLEVLSPCFPFLIIRKGKHFAF